MKENSILRQEARASLQNKWGMSALATFVYLVVVFAITGLLSLIPFVGSIAASLVMAPLGFGIIVMFIDQWRGEEMQLGTLFSGYDKRIGYTMVLKGVYVFLWTLLLIVPGIIKSYSYAMTPFLLKDNEELANNEAIEASMAMMEGHKMRLFLLDLSFIGWYLLSILTLGIASFWVQAYQFSARVAFYEDLKAQQAAFNVIE